VSLVSGRDHGCCCCCLVFEGSEVSDLKLASGHSSRTAGEGIVVRHYMMSVVFRA